LCLFVFPCSLQLTVLLHHLWRDRFIGGEAIAIPTITLGGGGRRRRKEEGGGRREEEEA